jgi:hypothetical protein
LMFYFIYFIFCFLTSFRRGYQVYARRWMMGGARMEETRDPLIWGILRLTEDLGLELHSLPYDHLLLDSVPNLGPLISCWEIKQFENCWYKSVRILEVLKLLFQQFLNWSSSQWDVSGPILGDLSNNRWSRGSFLCRILPRLVSSCKVEYSNHFILFLKCARERTTDCRYQCVSKSLELGQSNT